MIEGKTIEETVIEETPREQTEIRFTKNASQEYCDRFKNVDFVDCPDTFEEYKQLPLEREIRRRGVWYFDQEATEEFGEESYLCVVNNLKTFRAFKKPDCFLITTAYGHCKGKRGYLNEKLERRQDLDEEFKIGTQWEKKIPVEED